MAGRMAGDHPTLFNTGARNGSDDSWQKRRWNGHGTEAFEETGIDCRR